MNQSTDLQRRRRGKTGVQQWSQLETGEKWHNESRTVLARLRVFKKFNKKTTLKTK
jgi:hypothetical protein